MRMMKCLKRILFHQSHLSPVHSRLQQVPEESLMFQLLFFSLNLPVSQLHLSASPLPSPLSSHSLPIIFPFLTQPLPSSQQPPPSLLSFRTLSSGFPPQLQLQSPPASQTSPAPPPLSPGLPMLLLCFPQHLNLNHQLWRVNPGEDSSTDSTQQFSRLRRRTSMIQVPTPTQLNFSLVTKDQVPSSCGSSYLSC